MTYATGPSRHTERPRAPLAVVGAVVVLVRGLRYVGNIRFKDIRHQKTA